jgi:Holliday junction resolvase-like predicted endonuclease
LSKKYQRSEHQVQRWLVSQGWTALYHNASVFGVQIDLLCRSPEGVLTVVEVKQQTAQRLARISGPQRQRLLRICTFFSQWEQVEVKLALVEGAKVRVLPLDALTAW